MLFKPGKDERRGKGGKREGAGRHSNKQISEAKAELRGLEKACANLEAKIAQRADAINNRYLDLAETDPATLRHLVERYAKTATQQIDVNARHMVVFNTVDPNIERDKFRRAKLVSPDETEAKGPKNG